MKRPHTQSLVGKLQAEPFSADTSDAFLSLLSLSLDSIECKIPSGMSELDIVSPITTLSQNALLWFSCLCFISFLPPVKWVGL